MTVPLTTAFYPDTEVVTINAAGVAELKTAARRDPLGRARICLHRAPEDPIHEMLIAFYGRTYVRPHRNVRKSKSYCVVDGSMLIAVFDDAGTVTNRIVLSAQSSGEPFLCRLNCNCWHTVVPLSNELVFLETNGGPFVKEAEEYAAWAPESGDDAGIDAFFIRVAGTDRPCGWDSPGNLSR